MIEKPLFAEYSNAADGSAAPSFESYGFSIDDLLNEDGDLESATGSGSLESWTIENITMAIDPPHFTQADMMNTTQFRLAMLSLYSIIATMSLVGNTLHCWAIAKRRNLQTLSNIFMANLSVANILFVVVFTPIFISKYIFLAEWQLGTLFCKLCSSVSYFTGSSSFFLMALVAVERRQAIVRGGTRMKRRLGFFLIAAVWALAAAVSSPFFSFAGVSRLYMKFDFEPSGGSGEAVAQYELRCKVDFPIEYRRYVFLATILLQYAVPVLIIGPCYAQICVALWRQEMPNADRNAKKLQMKLLKRKRATVLMLIAIVLIFVLCWLPLFVVTMVIEFRVPMFFVVNLSTFLVCHLIASLSVCLSPCVYFASGVFRKELIRTLPYPGFLVSIGLYLGISKL